LASGRVAPETFKPAREGGREHDLLFDPERRRWIKFTKPAAAGYSIAVTGESIDLYPATPLQYLDRWHIHNNLFGDGVELVGLAGSGHTRRIVVAQPNVVGEDPTWGEIDEVFTSNLACANSL
jgi:hypothetical protein